MIKRKSVLGKGLNALIEENKTVEDNNGTSEILLTNISPNPNQPRKSLDGIDHLAASIKKHGILQPILLLKLGNDKYQIIAGERRWHASKKAGLKSVPAIVKTALSEQDKLVIGLIENLEREDLNPIDEAVAFQDLMNKFELTADFVAEQFGKNRSTITNSIRLLGLPKEVQDDLKKGLLQPGHARPLINLTDRKKILAIRKRIIDDQISVRDVERLCKEEKVKIVAKPQKVVKRNNVFLKDIEEKFQQKFATKVSINGSDNKGKLVIEYYSQDDLNRFLEIMNID